MLTNITQYHFDRGKPFYPILMNYLIQIYGFYELPLRGSYKVLKGLPKNEVEESLKKTPNLEFERLFKSSPIDLPKSLALRSEFQGNSIQIDIDDIALEVLSNGGYLIPFLMRSAGNLLILAYETTLKFHDKGPLWEFLRHCRNAAAHNGLFHFENGEPRRLAKWGKFQIEVVMHGTPLFGSKEKPGLLGPGDPIPLLWDIEQAYPNMSV